MTVWKVVAEPEEGKVETFITNCSPCAIAYYNEDRDHRSAPEPIEPGAGMAINGCVVCEEVQ